jgi:O-acetyl-ADP-ribose deacetylase (regulator of RNase III)
VGDIEGISGRFGGVTRIEAVIGDITRQAVEAIVNAANSRLWMGGGVAGAIKLAAGEKVEREAMAQGPIRPGEAVATSAGHLPPPIKWVIHAATMGPDLQTSEELVRLATASALRIAVEIGARSIALPAMGTGVGGFPMERAAQVMVEEARRAAAAESDLERIVFVLRDEQARRLFEEALA